MLYVIFNFGEQYAEQKLEVPLKAGVHEAKYGDFYQSSLSIEEPSSKALEERHGLFSNEGVPMKLTHYGWHSCDHKICHVEA